MTFTSSMIEKINRPTPKEETEFREIRGGKLAPYIEGSYNTKVLNDTFNYEWSFEITEIRREDDFITVFGKITYKGIVKADCGGAIIKRYKKSNDFNSEKIIDLADDYKAAITDCKKRCAVGFGFYSDVYIKENIKDKPDENSNAITNEQLSNFLNWAYDAGMDEETAIKYAEKEIGKSLNIATTVELYSLKPKLKALKKEGGVSNQ